MTSVDTVDLSASRRSTAILIVSYRRADVLRACLDSLRAHMPECRSFVWDNASDGSDAIQALAASYPEVQWYFHADNAGFAAAVNGLARRVDKEFLLLLNPDAELLTDLSPLYAALLDDSRAAAAGPWVENIELARPWDTAWPPVTPVSAAIEAAGFGRNRRVPGLRSRYPRSRSRVAALSGACLLVRRPAWLDVGEFDQRFWLYSEEIDWCTRARQAGWTLRQVPERLVRHAGAGTVSDSEPLKASSNEHLERSRRLFICKHYGRVGLLLYRALYCALRILAAASRPVRRALRSRTFWR